MKCPKCGSEMRETSIDTLELDCCGEVISIDALVCTNEDCGHEETVKEGKA